MIKVDVVHPILDLTLQESRRDNLLSCSCQEFFENMRRVGVLLVTCHVICFIGLTALVCGVHALIYLQDNMKEMINFCMTKHEPLIRQLAETPLGGQRFELLIRRYEMNNEPPPPDEPKAEKCVTISRCHIIVSVLIISFRTVDPRPWPGASRVPDEEEESYFNGDDDDEDLLPLPEFQTRQPHQRPPSPSIPLSNALKRKRRPAVGAATKGYRPPLRIPSLTQLVDYAEDENEDAVPDLSSTSRTTSSLLASPLPISTDGPPSSPKLFHRQVSASSSSANSPPPRRLKEEDDEEDNLLEMLARARSRPSTPTPSMMASSTGPGPMRPSEKRRRGMDDDDDEEGLERLTKASKKMGAGSSSSLQKARSPSPGRRQAAVSPSSPSTRILQPETTTTATTTEMPFSLTGAVPQRPTLVRTKPGEEPPKQRFKLKIGGASVATVSISSTTPPSTQSETGAKDGDTG